MVGSPLSLLSHYQALISGYVLYDSAGNSNSLNAATSLCGALNAVAVDATLETLVRGYGITNRLADVRTRDEAWAWTNYNASFSRDVVIEQKEFFTDNLRDYAVMSGAFTFFDGNSPFRAYIMQQMNPDGACLGWGDASSGESVFVGSGSSNGVVTVASDWALDLSTLSSVRDPSLNQHTRTNPNTETNVHYVTFVVTDGDNVQWNLGGFPGYFNQYARGGFNMGWSLSPALADLAPSVLRWYFENSSNAPGADFFIAGPSGSGYFYPSMVPPAALDLEAQHLNDLAGRADMEIVQILDFNSFNRSDLWNKYLTQPNIQSLFYLEYAPYNGAQGAVLFSTNGNPVIAARDMLWAGLEEETNVIANINSYPRDPSSPEGYTFVTVHVWSKNLANVRQVVTNLASDVRVVTPDAFAKLIRSNVGRKLSFDFRTALEGWVGGIHGGPYDKAWWTGTSGNPPGALLFDGSDLGHPDSLPNSWFSRQVILPQNVTSLSFDTAANNDGLLRLRLQRPDGVFVTLLDWEALPVINTWVNRSVSLSAFAGQTVTLWFEQNDGGQGSGEYRYVDNVSIQSSGPAVYLPAAPRILSAAAGSSVNVVWRNNDPGATTFSLERSAGVSGSWTPLASVPANLTNWLDSTVAPATTYSYRMRARNAAGFSPYSNVQTTFVPGRPSLMLAVSAGSVTLNWPAWATNGALFSTTNLSTTWLPVTNKPVPSGSNLTVTLPLTPAGGFYQLRN
jgi:hypothetical protein